MLRVAVGKIAPGEMVLDAKSSRYVARVRRARPGDRLVLFNPEARLEAEADVLDIGKGAVRCRVGPPRPAEVRARREVTLIQALAKGEKTDAVVRDATELGASRVIIAQTARSVVRLSEQAGAARNARWRRIAVEASRQSGRGDVPAVLGPMPWGAALVEHSTREGRKLCLWERATAPIGPALAAAATAPLIAVAVGPEGGLEEHEVEEAEKAGFVPVSIGPFVLRTETVAAAVLGAVLVLGTAGEERC